MRYEHDHGCPTPDALEQERKAGLRYLLIIGLIVFCCLAAGILGWLDSQAAVSAVDSRKYAVRLCSTCKEISYPTEAECIAAAKAEAGRVGATRETGSAVYTCIVRHNVVASFRPNTAGRATLTWAHDGWNIQGFRVIYGTEPSALVRSIDIANPAIRTHTIESLPPARYYFAVLAYYEDAESAPSNIVDKVIM